MQPIEFRNQPPDRATLCQKLLVRGCRITQEEKLLVRSPTRELSLTREWHLSDRNGQWFSYAPLNPKERFLAAVNWVLEYQSPSDLEFGPAGLELLLSIWHEILIQRKQAA